MKFILLTITITWSQSKFHELVQDSAAIADSLGCSHIPGTRIRAQVGRSVAHSLSLVEIVHLNWNMPINKQDRRRQLNENAAHFSLPSSQHLVHPLLNMIIVVLLTMKLFLTNDDNNFLFELSNLRNCYFVTAEWKNNGSMHIQLDHDFSYL